LFLLHFCMPSRATHNRMYNLLSTIPTPSADRFCRSAGRSLHRRRAVALLKCRAQFRKAGEQAIAAA